MPLLEKDIAPKYAAKGLKILVVHSWFEGNAPAYHKQWFGLSFPIGLDFDSEVFRRFRQPGLVFPLNVVIDAEGKIAHVGDELDEAEAAVAKLLP